MKKWIFCLGWLLAFNAYSDEVIQTAPLPMGVESQENDQIQVLEESVRESDSALVSEKIAISVSAPGKIEDWKGPSPHDSYTVGVLAGFSLYGSTLGFSTMGQFGWKILDPGFVQDINNQVFVEVEGGAIFLPATTVVRFGGHLRWDFHKDFDYAVFAIAGLAGNVSTGSTMLWQVYPNFGVGGLWKITDDLALRAQLTHENLGLGFMVSF